MPMSIIISNQPTLGSMQTTPITHENQMYILRIARAMGPGSIKPRRSFLVDGHRLIELFLDSGDALLELGHALAQRAHHAWQAVSEDEQAYHGDDNQLSPPKGWEEEAKGSMKSLLASK